MSFFLERFCFGCCSACGCDYCSCCSCACCPWPCSAQRPFDRKTKWARILVIGGMFPLVSAIISIVHAIAFAFDIIGLVGGAVQIVMAIAFFVAARRPSNAAFLALLLVLVLEACRHIAVFVLLGPAFEAALKQRILLQCMFVYGLPQSQCEAYYLSVHRATSLVSIGVAMVFLMSPYFCCAIGSWTRYRRTGDKEESLLEEPGLSDEEHEEEGGGIVPLVRRSNQQKGAPPAHSAPPPPPPPEAITPPVPIRIHEDGLNNDNDIVVDVVEVHEIKK